MKENKLGYKIKTNLGWKDFSGISYNGKQQVCQLILDNNVSIKGTFDHKIFIDWFSWKTIKDLKIGQDILCSDGFHKIVSKENLGLEDVYDVLEVGENNRFYANGVLVHNCEFIGQSNTLISSDILRELIDRTRNKSYSYLIDGDVRMYKELDPKMKYFISVDPAMGCLGDFSAIQIMEYPTMEQVGEWQSDELNQNDQIEKINDIVQEMWKRLRDKGAIESNIYWSLENNSVGQGLVCTLRELAKNDEYCEDFRKYIRHATLINQRKKSNNNDDIIGFNTNKTSKTIASSQLKTLLETKKIILNSYPLVKELSNYTRKSVSYSADKSEHDDLISALLINLMMYLQEKEVLGLSEFNYVYSDKKDNTVRDDEVPFIFFSV